MQWRSSDELHFFDIVVPFISARRSSRAFSDEDMIPYPSLARKRVGTSTGSEQSRQKGFSLLSVDNDDIESL